MAAPARAQAMPCSMIVSTVSGMPGCSLRLQAPFNATSIQTFRIEALPAAAPYRKATEPSALSVCCSLVLFQGWKRLMVLTPTVEKSTLGLHSIQQYEPLIGRAAVARILDKAERLGPAHLVHISSTFYGGGVTEILTPL